MEQEVQAQNGEEMDRTERFYKICRALEKGAAIPATKFINELEISRATFHRDIEYLQSRFNAPIIYDRRNRGYHFDPNAPQFTLPGVWFTATEVESLLTINKMLSELQPDLLGAYINPIQERIGKLLERRNSTYEEVRSRIRILAMANRNAEANYFELISHAVLERKRLQFMYYSRGRNEIIQRHVSPQRLVHYRDNWYLDAYDHQRNALRTFSLDAIKELKVLEQKARNIADKRLNTELGSSYGIFAGKNTQTAVLRFTPFRSRWVALEHWHPEQKGEMQPDGSYLLRIPYSDDRELLMDILKYGEEVEVVGPKELREKVQNKLQQAAQNYAKK
jgi:predicted DNA-binding transcriptional regulator YafY